MKYLQYSLVVIAAAVFTYFGFEAQKQFRNTLEKNEVRSLLASRAKLGTGREVVSITESGFAGRYFFQVAKPGEAGVTVAYGWIEPEACKGETAASCIEIVNKDAVLRAQPPVDSLSPAGDPSEISTAVPEPTDGPASDTATPEPTEAPGSTDRPAGDTTTAEPSPDSTAETAPSSVTRSGDAPGSQQSEDARYRVTAAKVNVRAGPGTAYEVVDVMTPEATFVILEAADDWSKVASDESGNPVQGWIWSELIAGAE